MRQVFNPHTGKPDYVLDADSIALSLYGLGMMLVVAGPMVAGTDPPQMAPATAVQVAHLLSIGIPEAYIGWNVTGSETGTVGSFALPSVTLTPVVTAPSLSGAQGGSFALPSVTLQPQVVAPTLTGVQVGAFALPAVTMQPLVSAPTLFGVQAGVGVFALPTVTLQPQVAAPTLAGVQVGSFALPAVTVQPQVSAPSLAGLQVGSFALPAVSLRPVVTAPTLVATVAATSGSFALPSVTLQPVVTAPTLTGVSGGAPTTTLESFATSAPNTSTGNTSWANTATWNGWTIANQGYNLLSNMGTLIGAYIIGASGAGYYHDSPYGLMVIPAVTPDDPDTGDPGVASGFKLTKTWGGPFPDCYFAFWYRIVNNGGLTGMVADVNGTNITLVADNTWRQTTPVALTAPASITLTIQNTPASYLVQSANSYFILDTIAY